MIQQIVNSKPEAVIHSWTIDLNQQIKKTAAFFQTPY